MKHHHFVARCFLLLLLTCFSLEVVCKRDIIPFDFGWKHRTGLHDWADPEELPPSDTDPGQNPPEAARSYDSSSWVNVQLPHDGLIGTKPSQKACPDGCSGRSYIPRHVLWYRKVFSLPTTWKDKRAIWIEFDGSFRNTTVWVNGEKILNHVCGYTPFRIRLDDLASLSYGQSPSNSIAVFVDPDNGDYGGPSRGSGWWYEGGGLYRHARLVSTTLLHLEQDSLFARSEISFSSDGTARSADLNVEVSIVNDGSDQEDICVLFLVTDSGVGNRSDDVISSELIDIKILGNETVVSESIRILYPKLWTSAKPYLYHVSALLVDCASGDRLDDASTMHGFRSLHYDANEGFFLNQRHFKVRGFCDHDTFGVVGMAVPDRINLFRAQASRAIGGNGRRMSHNPPDPSLLDIYDRLGIVVIDENRLFDDNPSYVENMVALVKRDRNHPSVIVWSFCNENGCEGDHESGGPSFQAVVEKYDGTRPSLANMFTFNDLLSNTIDIQGFSHESREKLDDCHAALPEKPIFMSECCSCNTMRGEDVGCETQRDNPHTACTQMSFNARCLDQMVNASDGVDYAIGTMVWTLFDYYGEPPKAGLHVSSTYGQFDLCGFPKHAAFWFRTQWLLGVADENPDKTFPTDNHYEVQIVESWESPDTWNETRGNTTRTIHAYSNAPSIELFVNNKTQGSLPVYPMVYGGGSYAEWIDVPWEAGTLTAVAKSKNGTNLASTVRQTSGTASTIRLSLDCPTPRTGTGHAVLLDGQDIALVRAEILDDSGQVVHMATNNVTFAIVSGPGSIIGSANGDPKSYEANNARWHSAYHGMVRGVVRVTSIAALSKQELYILDEIDGSFVLDESFSLSEENIVIQATSPGLKPVELLIPTSIDKSRDGVIEVAENAAGTQVDFFDGQSRNLFPPHFQAEVKG